MQASLSSSSLLFVVLTGLVSAGCTQPAVEEDLAESAESAVEVFAPDLWAGLASSTTARWADDPCNDGKNRLDNEPINYDSWVRERAGIRNVCFEVWKPGVTDRENPDFWRLLDVQVHYRYKGTSEWKMAYVPSIDRRGNNRRYAWSLARELDPVAGISIADVKAPFTITGETSTSVQARVELEFYFTVNGHRLSTSTNDAFRVAYTGYVQKPTFEVTPPGNVLHPEIVCAGGALRIGSGPGYFAADVKGTAAIAALGAGLDGSKIYAARVGVGGTGTKRVLSIPFGTREHAAPGTFPRYVEGFGEYWRAETKDAGAGKVTVTVKAYDRASGQFESLSHTFTGCVTQP